ncbi:MAG: hypothetical protein IPJ81_17720 [Chitinophagaceae bacterium]|nr:hypothetical protein [Chitinophagaceae bacterium]
MVWVDLAVNAGTTYGNSRIGITISNINIDEVLASAVKPATLLEYIQDINAIGTWSIKTFTVSGTFLTVIWIIEALMITGIPLFMSYLAAKKPFCEIGNVWFKEKILPPFPVINEKEKLLQTLKTAIHIFLVTYQKPTI